jgi:hypothetical protein
MHKIELQANQMKCPMDHRTVLSQAGGQSLLCEAKRVECFRPALGLFEESELESRQQLLMIVLVRHRTKLTRRKGILQVFFGYFNPALKCDIRFCRPIPHTLIPELIMSRPWKNATAILVVVWCTGHRYQPRFEQVPSELAINGRQNLPLLENGEWTIEALKKTRKKNKRINSNKEKKI